MIKIFISHSSRDKQTINNILEYLPRSVSCWIDQDQMIAGEKITQKIIEGINQCHLFLLFVSPEATESEWVKKEIEIAKAKEKKQNFKLPFLIPVIMGDLEDRFYQLFDDEEDERKFLKLHGYEDSDIKQLGKEIRETIESWTAAFVEVVSEQDIAPKSEVIIPKDKLWVRVANYEDGDLWNDLEDICVNAVVAGGITAMTYFKEARRVSRIIKDSKNPSEIADLQATVSIIRSFDAQIENYLSDLGCDLFYLGEETVYQEEEISQYLGKKLDYYILPKDEFFNRAKNSIRVIIDAIDGTSNFSRGIPFFCSSIAVFIEDQLRVSAIYDPLHHQVYSGLLAGPYANPQIVKSAKLWDITTGFSVDMIKNFSSFALKQTKRSMAVHITRTDEDKRDQFISPGESGKVLFRELVANLDTVYALNSGLLALAQIANCGIDSFVNLTTNSWDVAAGEVILKACGGMITDFDGNPIDYSHPEKINVVAANSKNLHDRLLKIINLL